VQALGGVPQPLQLYPRSGLLIEAVLGEGGGGGVLRRACPAVAALLRECLHIDGGTRPCAREVVDRLLAIGASASLGVVDPGTWVGSGGAWSGAWSGVVSTHGAVASGL
jgi:hypothetical protein